MEAFAAVDADGGQPVVVKRPHPTLIARGIHGGAERRAARGVALRRELGGDPPHTARLIAYTDPADHRAYFGDGLRAEYAVFVEERAAGVPLVGSAMDGIKGYPVGLPQNLFDLHPITPHPERRRFHIARAVLEIAAAFDRAGTVLLDCRPQNLYFAPATGNVMLIDIGGATAQRPADRRNRQPIDMHDFYLELFLWHLPAQPPPADPAMYAQPVGMESVPAFRQSLDAMMRRRQSAPDTPSQQAALAILRNIQARAYSGVPDFAADFDAYISLLDAEYDVLAQDPAVSGAWAAALDMMDAPHWRKFLFHPDDLAPFKRGR